jgi:hypothetical protein
MRGNRWASLLAAAGASLAVSGVARAQQPPAPVWVHVDGSSSVAIQRETPLGWRTVCAGTCDAMLPAGASYRVDGATLFPSAPFTLRGEAGQSETLQIHGASEPLFVFGILGVVGSGLVLGLTWPVGAYWGLCVVGTGLSGGGGSGTGGCVLPGEQGLLTAFLVSGAVALASTVLVATNYKTTVEQLFPGIASGPSVGRTSTTPSVQASVGLPAPSWKENVPERQLQTPLMGVPVLQGRF